MSYGFPNISFIGYPVALPCAGHAGLGFREARRGDAPAILDHFRALDPVDRRMRFCASVSEATLERHVETLWDRNAFVLSAHAGPLWPGLLHSAGTVQALAEVSLFGGTAEIGLSVDANQRRRCVGTHLVQTVGHLLALRGARSLLAFTLRDNASMLALARRSGARIEFDPGEIAITFSVAALNAAYLRRRFTLPAFAPAA